MISLPPAFTERMQQLLGNESETFFQALVSESPTSIRLNPEKTANTDLPFSELLSRQVPWCSNGYYLKERPSFTSDPLLHGGAYYVQEASSMFLQVVLQQITGDTPLRVLDLCAAPGGKSTLLANNLPKDSLLVSNEVIKSRASILKENIIKWGYDHIVVTNSNPNRFTGMKGAFDMILVDAPCSGLGVIRKKPDIRYHEPSAELPALQRAILAQQAEYVRPGGVLLYSTCTILRRENEAVAEDFLRTHPDFVPENAPWPEGSGIAPGAMVTLLPGQHETDGFFICKFRRKP